MIALYISIVLMILALIYFLFCYFLSSTILFLNRQPVPKNPSDYGLDFEDVEFISSDGAALKGWLIPGSMDKLVIMTHVGGLTKYGSTAAYRNFSKLYNKEIEFIKTAMHLHNKGYWVLMFDFRNHGESGRSPNGGKTGVGLEEYKDVTAAMNFIKNRDDLKGFDIGFVSFCMGANSTIIAMSKEPSLFGKVRCMVAIQPISMEVFVRSYAKKILTPFGARLIVPMVKRFVNWRSKHPLESMSPYGYVKDIEVPTLYIQARNDPWTELSDIQSFYDDTPEPKEFCWIENTKHRFESYSYFQDKPEKILEWLKRWM
jgi:alpha-beta hydrolase superfamily lysophospholipase